ncbi:MAG: hypothetical protein LBS22_03605 [Puniceicoccales bacterium]|jgi:hypothetical protein|nr:hypothetical protein [Puniceicoccales bacterium]
MESSQKAENNICRVELMEDRGAAYGDSQPRFVPCSMFHEKTISVHFGPENSYCSKSKFFSNPLRTREVCVVVPTQSNNFTDRTDRNRTTSVFELYAKQGDKIFKLKNNILKNLKPLADVEVVKLKSLVNSKFNSAFRERNLSVPDHVKLQVQTSAFFDSIISSIVKPESVLLVRQSWTSTSKSWGVYEIYAICQYILGDIFEAAESQ